MKLFQIIIIIINLYSTTNEILHGKHILNAIIYST
jgi:hypothetical protein